MFGSRLGFLGSADRMALFPVRIKSKMAADGHLGMTALSRLPLRQLGFLVFCLQEVFDDVRDDEDDEFEVVPVKPTKTDDDFSDGLCCCVAACEIIFVHLWLYIMPSNLLAHHNIHRSHFYFCLPVFFENCVVTCGVTYLKVVFRKLKFFCSRSEYY